MDTPSQPEARRTIRFDVLTLFPDLFAGYTSQSLLKLAIRNGLVQIHLWNIRDWTQDKHTRVDDRPFGGGPGMVMMCQPVVDCVEAVRAKAEPPGRLVMLTPAGRRLTQPVVEELAAEPRLLLLCGRYEGAFGTMDPMQSNSEKTSASPGSGASGLSRGAGFSKAFMASILT